MDVQDFVDEIQNNRGFDDIDASDILAVLNDTYHELNALQPWPFLEKASSLSTVQGDASPFSSVTDVRSVIKLIDVTNGITLNRIRWDDLLSLYASALDETGQPIFFYFIGNEIRIHPIPDAAYTLYLAYYQDDVDLTLTSVTTDILIPSRHQRILLHGALARLYQLNDDAESSVFQQNLFNDRITKMQNDVWMRDYGTKETIRDVYELED